ncbi:TonB-dependent receptor-like protein [Lutibacter oceani]|uniref:TonB-dependent receptor-like protein n=1 Tax=Lutibacter oceani TaxID=1853311 RepID=A0A3D9RZJ5_9FLAO|nr:carboxypeptidase-like regulatory domain-containing protein [Lutibacter oceani]REE81912.1 TonB-dependent receptor-like protein [Lutibacter oceani]
MNIKYYFIVLFLINVNILYSQTEISLKQTLKNAENKYKVFFSYNDEELTHLAVYNKELPDILDTFLADLKEAYQISSIKTGKNIYALSLAIQDFDTKFSGVIIDKNTNLPIEGALVFVNDLNSITDANGKFEFIKRTVPKNIQISHIAYGKYNVTISGTKNYVEIKISAKETELDLVEISYLAKGISKNSEGAFVLNPKNQGVLGGLINADVFQSIQFLPGVTNSQENATDLFVHGSTPDQNLILWNGIRLYQTGHLLGGISSVNPNSVNKVNFFSNGVSAKYGNHTGGLIEISTLMIDSINSNASLGINLLDVDFSSNLKIGSKITTDFSFRRSFTDVLQLQPFNNLMNQTFKNSSITTSKTLKKDVYYYDFSGGVNYKLNKNNTLRIHGLMMLDKFNYSFEEDEYLLNENLYASSKSGGIVWNNETKKNNTQITANYTEYEMDYFQRLSEYEDDDYEEEQLQTRNNKIKEINFNINRENILTEVAKIQLGYQWNEKKIVFDYLSRQEDDYSITDSQKSIIGTHSLFSNFTAQKPENYFIRFGVRLNYYDQLNSFQFEPRIYTKKTIANHFNVNASFEIKTQASLQTYETVSDTFENGNQLWVGVDGEQFPLLNVHQFNGGVSFNNKSFLIDIEYFKKGIESITTFNYGFLDPNDQDFHEGESEIEGFDFFLRNKTGVFTSWLSYTYTDAVNIFKELNNSKSFPGNQSIKHQLIASTSVDIANLNIALAWKWHTGKPYSYPSKVTELSATTYRFSYDRLNTFTLPNYKRMDISLGYEFKNFKSKVIPEIELSFVNILKAKNILHRFFTYNFASKEIVPIDRYSIQPTFNLSFRLKY